MANPFIIDISQNNTPIAQGERPGDAPKTCGCGGKSGGACGTAAGTTKVEHTIMMGLIVIALAVCYFVFA